MSSGLFTKKIIVRGIITTAIVMASTTQAVRHPIVKIMIELTGGKITAERKPPIPIKLMALPRYLTNQKGIMTPGTRVIEPWPKNLSKKMLNHVVQYPVMKLLTRHAVISPGMTKKITIFLAPNLSVA